MEPTEPLMAGSLWEGGRERLGSKAKVELMGSPRLFILHFSLSCLLACVPTALLSLPKPGRKKPSAAFWATSGGHQ
jgi:hypothetical protein